jgi:hypothetical protein
MIGSASNSPHEYRRPGSQGGNATLTGSSDPKQPLSEKSAKKILNAVRQDAKQQKKSSKK